MYSSMLKYIEQLLKSSSVLDQTSKTKGSNTSSKSIAFVHTGFFAGPLLRPPSGPAMMPNTSAMWDNVRATSDGRSNLQATSLYSRKKKSLCRDWMVACLWVVWGESIKFKCRSETSPQSSWLYHTTFVKNAQNFFVKAFLDAAWQKWMNACCGSFGDQFFDFWRSYFEKDISKWNRKYWKRW